MNTCLLSILLALAIGSAQADQIILVPNRNFDTLIGWTTFTCGLNPALEPYSTGIGNDCWYPGAASVSIVPGATFGGQYYAFSDLGIPGVDQGVLISSGNFGVGFTGNPAESNLIHRTGIAFTAPAPQGTLNGFYNFQGNGAAGYNAPHKLLAFSQTIDGLTQNVAELTNAYATSGVSGWTPFSFGWNCSGQCVIGIEVNPQFYNSLQYQAQALVTFEDMHLAPEPGSLVLLGLGLALLGFKTRKSARLV